MNWLKFPSKKVLTALVLVVFLIFFSTPLVSADVPKLLTYHGILKNSGGSYLDGDYDITFRIYDASTGGTALWTEAHTDVNVDSGRFSAVLGSSTTLNLTFGADYWISVQVESDSEMTPRQQITSVGYALKAQEVVDGFTLAEHNDLSHENISGIKANTIRVAKTNFKLDSYTSASANDLGSMVVDTFSDDDGIDDTNSSNYTWNSSPDYDVTLTASGGDVAESCTGTNTDMYEILSNVANYYNGAGESFSHASSITVDKISFKMKRYGSPTGNIRYAIYSESSGLPDTLLGSTGNIDVSTIETADYEEIEMTLTSSVNLTASTTYFVVIENVDASGDGSNHIKVNNSGSGDPYSSGSSYSKSSSDVWALASSSNDMYFKIYEALAYSGTATVISNSTTASAASSEAMVMADETLNDGSITYSVSRDGGTTWTACTKDTVTDISSQPSGTQMKWKVSITDDAELNAIAVAY